MTERLVYSDSSSGHDHAAAAAPIQPSTGQQSDSIYIYIYIQCVTEAACILLSRISMHVCMVCWIIAAGNINCNI